MCECVFLSLFSYISNNKKKSHGIISQIKGTIYQNVTWFQTKAYRYQSF